MTSAQIGAKVLEKLRDVDEVAYLRYASVHRHFSDVDEFVDAITYPSVRDYVTDVMEDYRFYKARGHL